MEKVNGAKGEQTDLISFYQLHIIGPFTNTGSWIKAKLGAGNGSKTRLIEG